VYFINQSVADGESHAIGSGWTGEPSGRTRVIFSRGRSGDETLAAIHDGKNDVSLSWYADTFTGWDIVVPAPIVPSCPLMTVSISTLPPENEMISAP
jgi:hypothetical protein